MHVSSYPPHVSDRLLEEAQSLIRLIRIAADVDSDEDWREARQGILALFLLIEEEIASAREVLDDA